MMRGMFIRLVVLEGTGDSWRDRPDVFAPRNTYSTETIETKINNIGTYAEFSRFIPVCRTYMHWSPELSARRSNVRMLVALGQIQEVFALLKELKVPLNPQYHRDQVWWADDELLQSEAPDRPSVTF